MAAWDVLLSASFLAGASIGLRECMEAVLVVGLLISYLSKTDRHESVKLVWWGVAAGIALSLATVAANTVNLWPAATIRGKNQVPAVWGPSRLGVNCRVTRQLPNLTGRYLEHVNIRVTLCRNRQCQPLTIRGPGRRTRCPFNLRNSSAVARVDIL